MLLLFLDLSARFFIGLKSYRFGLSRLKYGLRIDVSPTIYSTNVLLLSFLRSLAAVSTPVRITQNIIAPTTLDNTPDVDSESGRDGRDRLPRFCHLQGSGRKNIPSVKSSHSMPPRPKKYIPCRQVLDLSKLISHR